MKIEYVDAGELDVRSRDLLGKQRLWRIPSCYQPVIDGDPHDQIRVHRPLKDMESKRKWVATCVYTGLSLNGSGQSTSTREQAVEASLTTIAGIEDMRWLLGKARIPDGEPVYIVWYPRAKQWLKPQYEIVHAETSAAAGERYAATLPSAMEKVRNNHG